MFYWPTGIVSAACATGITIEREVSESSDRPRVKRIQHSHAPYFFYYWRLLGASSLDVITQERKTQTREKQIMYVLVLFEKRRSFPDPGFKVFSWNTVVSKLYARQGKMPKVSRDICVTLMTDGWTSRDAKSFLTEAVYHDFLERDEKLFCRKPFINGHLSSAPCAAVTLICIHI